MQSDKKQRDTKQRRLVYDTVMRHKDHPNAETIYRDVHVQDGHVSKATVYRNLKALSEKGEILQVKASGADRYDSTLKDHYHIVCTACGMMSDAPLHYFSEADRMVERENGFRITRHNVVFEGICPACLAKMNVLGNGDSEEV